jgi:hypothetical protein
MKFQYMITGAALAAVTAAKPHPRLHHRHAQAHAHGLVKREIYGPAATETAIIYWLDDHAISEEEVRQGIANGTLTWGNDGVLSTSTEAAVVLPTPPPVSKQQAHVAESTPEPKVQEPAHEEPAQDPKSQQSAAPSAPGPSPSVATPPSQNPDTSPNPWVSLVDKDGYCAECDKEFPNGKIPCTEFPYGYGALPLDNEGLGGWSGIQDPQYRGADGFDDITTVPKGSCADGTCCTTGSFCSYGCPNPYLKASFPSIQGRTKQSVGGLYCNKDGYLEMADGSIAKSLCVQGSKHMSVKVQNKLSKSVSFCRTDYPGKNFLPYSRRWLTVVRHRVHDLPRHCRSR